MTKFSPIVLFVYNRPSHTRRTLEALSKNPEAINSDLFVFSDGARSDVDYQLVAEVRNYVATAEGFNNVFVHQRLENMGLANSVIAGVNHVLNESDTVIVLEDDLVTSEHFLKYMNEGLAKFADDHRVISIHGYVYPTKENLPEAFFLQGADCWGWATWRRGWSLFDSDAAKLAAEIRRKNLARAFDFDGSYPFLKMLDEQAVGKIDSWAIRWAASAFLRGKLTLYPGRSLVFNGGLDATGTHTGSSFDFDTVLSSSPISLDGVEVEDSGQARSAFRQFFQSGRRLKRITLKVLQMFKCRSQ
jgi:hypothetical protein